MGSRAAPRKVDPETDHCSEKEFNAELVACMRRLSAFCRSITGNRDAGDDLAQRTLEKALQARKQFTPGSNMIAWLFIIARNQFISELRHRNKWHAEWNPELAERILTDGIGETSAESAIDFERTLAHLALLPPEQRDAIVAVGYLGLSYEDAAFRIQTKVGTIKSRVARGRMTLTARLETGEPIPEDIDFSPLLERAERTPKSHPFHPIAQAFVMLYGNQDIRVPSSPSEASAEDAAWKELMASGALDFEDDHLSDF